MKALLILIVAAGIGDTGRDAADQSLQIQRIEFSSLAACVEAADRLTEAGRRTIHYQKAFGTEAGTNRVLAAPPVITAECVKL